MTLDIYGLFPRIVDSEELAAERALLS